MYIYLFVLLTTDEKIACSIRLVVVGVSMVLYRLLSEICVINRTCSRWGDIYSTASLATATKLNSMKLEVTDVH